MERAMEPHDSAKSVDPGALEGLGKSAARLSETSGLSLTEAVVRKIASMCLSSEQVRRVVEACNIEAVNRKYAALEGPNRIVHIDGGPADPVQVLQSVKTASASTPIMHIEALDYTLPPLAEKRASAYLPPVVAPNVVELRDKLASAHDEVSQRLEASSFRMEEALDTLKVAAHTAALEGATLAELYTAWAKHSEILAKVASAQLAKEISWGQVFSGREIAGDHKVVHAFKDFAKYAQRFYQESKARMDIETQLSRIDTHLRERAS